MIFINVEDGWKYLCTAVKFKYQQKKQGNMSLKDFIISAGGQAFVCLLPNKIRRWFYFKFLR